MLSSDETLSYKTGYYIAKGVHFYMSRRPAVVYDFAEKFNVSERCIKICKICAAVIFLFSVTDIHRYGAWYSGGATYIKPYWQFLYFLIWLPMVYAAVRSLYVLMKRMRITVLLVPPLLFVLWFAGLSAAFFAEEGFCVFHGYIFFKDYELSVLLENALAGAIVSVFVLVCFFRIRNPIV